MLDQGPAQTASLCASIIPGNRDSLPSVLSNTTLILVFSVGAKGWRERERKEREKNNKKITKQKNREGKERHVKFETERDPFRDVMWQVANRHRNVLQC